MIESKSKVVVIGGGVVGAGTLYHLAKKGWTDVVLLERKDLTSGSTWHAAGLLPLFNMSYSVGKLHQYSVDFYHELQEEIVSSNTGGYHIIRPVGLTNETGSDKIMVEEEKVLTNSKVSRANVAKYLVESLTENILGKHSICDA